MIRRWFRSLRRAPGRVLASTFALALAVAAIGVFAIPTVAADSLRDATDRDGVANIIVGTTDTGALDVEAVVGAVDNVDVVDPQIIVDVPIDPTGGPTGSLTVVGARLGEQQINIVRATTGRLPAADGEILLPEGAGRVGDTIDVVGLDGTPFSLDVVGTGGTSFFTSDPVAFATLDTAAAIGDLDGVNRLSVQADDASDAALRDTAAALRDALAADGVTLEYLPVTIADGIHPVEAEIEQISTLIGLLGIVAGIVGLVLLASTTNTMIVERTREVAVMRALGATPREMRRRLRRIALGIAAAAVIIGVPLGIVLSNVIARMVLQEFVGLTPDPSVSVPVIAGSALFALVGARLVAARSARRVTRLALVDALRDRGGRPFGRRRLERLTTRFHRGGLLGRIALRTTAHGWARSFAIAAQVGAAVAALLIITSLATTVNDFNEAELEPWRWNSMTWVAGPGLDIDATVADDDPRAEAAIEVVGDTLGWQIDVYGFEPDTAMVATDVVTGDWFTSPDQAVVSAGFARHTGIEVGDVLDVELASGTHRYEVSGLHPNRGREIYLDRGRLGTDLGDPDGANRIFSLDPAPDFGLTGVVGVDRLEEIRGDDSGRTAVLLIFGAIGVVVVSVAALAVASGLAVGIHERRHEIAALQAIGGRRRDVVRLLSAEMLGLGVVGLGIGVVGGYVGGLGIIRSFEVSNAVDIGFVFADRLVPLVAIVVIAGLCGLAALMVRPVTRRPIAETLRGAA